MRFIHIIVSSILSLLVFQLVLCLRYTRKSLSLSLIVPAYTIIYTLFEDSGSLDDVGSLDLSLDERDVHHSVWSGLGLRLLQHGIGTGESPW